MNGSRDITRCFDILLAETRFPYPARNYCSRSPSADGDATELVARAHIYLISPRDGKSAASGRSVYSARRVAAIMALAFVRAARQAAQACRNQWFSRSRHPFGWRHQVAKRPYSRPLKAGRHGARRQRHYQAAAPTSPLRQRVWGVWSRDRVSGPIASRCAEW